MLLDNNKKQNKQKTKNKHSLKDYWIVFNFSYKNIIHDKIIFYDVALLVQKKAMRVGYERSIKKLWLNLNFMCYEMYINQ